MSSNMDSTKIYSKCSSDFDIIPTASEVCVTTTTHTSDNTTSDTPSDNTTSDNTTSNNTTSDNTPSDNTTSDTTSDNTTSNNTTSDNTTSDTPTNTMPSDNTTSDTPTNTMPSDNTTSDTPTDTTPSDDLNSQSDLHLQNNTFNFIKDSDVYIVSVDGCPKFYVNTEKAAYDKMWEVTRLLSSKYVFDGYRTQYIKVKNNELHILGSYRFFIVAYDQILNRITYNKIYQCL